MVLRNISRGLTIVINLATSHKINPLQPVHFLVLYRKQSSGATYDSYSMLVTAHQIHRLL